MKNSSVLRLIGLLMLLMVFAFVVIPLINAKLIPENRDAVQSRNINAGALFYSDSEEAVESNYLMLKD